MNPAEPLIRWYERTAQAKVVQMISPPGGYSAGKIADFNGLHLRRSRKIFSDRNLGCRILSPKDLEVMRITLAVGGSLPPDEDLWERAGSF